MPGCVQREVIPPYLDAADNAVEGIADVVEQTLLRRRAEG
jgi:hypothetical protein